MSKDEILLPKGISVLRKINIALIFCDGVLLLFCGAVIVFFQTLLRRMTDIDTQSEMHFVMMAGASLAVFALLSLIGVSVCQRGLKELDGRIRKYLTALYVFHFWLIPMLGVILGGAGLGILLLSKETKEVLEDGEGAAAQKGLAIAAVISVLFIAVQILFYGMGNRVVKAYEQKIDDYRTQQNAETAAHDEFRKKLPEGSLYDPKTGNVYF